MKDLRWQSADGLSKEQWEYYHTSKARSTHSRSGIDDNKLYIRCKICVADSHLRVSSAHGLRKPLNTHISTHCIFRSSWRAFSPRDIFIMYTYTQSSTPGKSPPLNPLLAKEEASYIQIHQNLNHPFSTCSFHISCRRPFRNPTGH